MQHAARANFLAPATIREIKFRQTLKMKTLTAPFSIQCRLNGVYTNLHLKYFTENLKQVLTLRKYINQTETQAENVTACRGGTGTGERELMTSQRPCVADSQGSKWRPCVVDVQENFNIFVYLGNDH